MRNKLLSIFLATLMIFGGSFASFAVDPEVLEYYGPIEVKGQQNVDAVMPIINLWLKDNGYQEFPWISEKIDNWGTSNDYINFTPPSGGTNLYTLHYNKAIPDVIKNEVTGLYDIVPSDPPRKLEYFFIKSATNIYVMILPEPLAVGQSIYVQLPADISHSYVGSYESPTELYSIISGYKYDADTSEPELPIYGMSFDFEIYDEDDNLVATAFSDPGTGELFFTMLDDQGDPIPDLTDKLDLELPEGTFFIKEVNIPEGYEFVRFEVRDSMYNLIDSGDEDPVIEFLSEDGLKVSFIFFNRMKDSTIKAFKFNADEEGLVPILGVPFDFEIWEDKDGGEKVAIGRSDDTGKVLFYTDWDLDGEPIDSGVEDLVLLYGNYLIKEVNLPDAYEFIRFAMFADGEELDLSEEGDDPEYPFSVGDVNTFRFEFYNRMKDSTLTGLKLDQNGMPFDGISFNFDIYNALDEKIANAVSDSVDGTLMFAMLDEFGEPILPRDDTLVLPYGSYYITELDLTGYDFVKAQLFVDGELVIPDFLTPTVLFSAGDANSIHFVFNNIKEVQYKDYTAYAIYGPGGGGTLNSIRGNNNWGWYINAPILGEGQTVFYDIYAGAGQNDISKGIYVGQVEIGINGGYYETTFHLVNNVILDEVHFGSYVKLTDIPKGVGNFSQTVTANKAKYIVIHTVVSIPQ